MGVQERRAREASRREREILDAALRLFRRDDWESVTIEQIAEQVEISRGTVYNHFGSKDQLYARLALDFQRDMLEAWRAIDPALPVLERVHAVFRLSWEGHLQSQELHRVVLHCYRPEFRLKLDPDIAREFDALDRDFAQIVGSFLREAGERGLLPARPLELMVVGPRAAFWGGIQLAWISRLAPFDRESYFEELWRFMLAGTLNVDPPADGAWNAGSKGQIP